MVHNTHIMKMLGFVNKLNWHQRINANTSGKESKREAQKLFQDQHWNHSFLPPLIFPLKSYPQKESNHPSRMFFLKLIICKITSHHIHLLFFWKKRWPVENHMYLSHLMMTSKIQLWMHFFFYFFTFSGATTMTRNHSC